MESLNCVEESPTASVACIYYTHMPVQFYDNFHERLSITAYATHKINNKEKQINHLSNQTDINKWIKATKICWQISKILFHLSLADNFILACFLFKQADSNYMAYTRDWVFLFLFIFIYLKK